ncbi:MAG: peroxide stress protein YaaA [Lentimonas sp.]
MLILLSPAKSLDYEAPLLTKKASQPRLAAHSAELISELKALSPKAVGALMSISPKLAELNHARFQNYQPTFTAANSRQAILAFTGDVYQGMDLAEWSVDDLAAAQKQIRILSGLYGVLRPLDRMQPYRLEMGTKFQNARGSNLYQFWSSIITKLLNKDLQASGSDLVVNLASNEYFSSIKPKELNGQLITPVFKDEKNGTYKIISFYAKKARGMMANFIVRNQVRSIEGLQAFNGSGYRFDTEASEGNKLVFLRAEQ